MANTVIEVKKNPNENNASILRRFSRRIQESGIIRKVKGARYNIREESKLKVKKSALKRMARRQEIEKLFECGFFSYQTGRLTIDKASGAIREVESFKKYKWAK